MLNSDTWCVYRVDKHVPLLDPRQNGQQEAARGPNQGLVLMGVQQVLTYHLAARSGSLHTTNVIKVCMYIYIKNNYTLQWYRKSSVTSNKAKLDNDFNGRA